jgi:hypothetical protein
MVGFEHIPEDGFAVSSYTTLRRVIYEVYHSEDREEGWLLMMRVYIFHNGSVSVPLL